jgi:predicted 2-oxoglutarate/Fe(II)-dependent dioxygenase YbiX
MCDSQLNNLFEVQKYTYLKNVLPKEDCDKLTNELKNFVANKQTEKDPQCPISESIHGAPIFDALLEHLLPVFEQASGKKLFPTYSYARLYTPGEELEMHTDRHACEISASLTLGFDGDIWPIYMADNDETKTSEKRIGEKNTEYWLKNVSQISIEVGDAVLYRGMDKVHWREPYKEGQWQAQVFLHYVDANGPNAEWKYDKRSRLNHHTTIDNVLYWHFDNAFPIEAAKRVIESAEVLDKEEAKVGGNSEGVIDKKIRDVKKIPLSCWNGLGAQMVGMALAANKQAWKFDITHSNQCDYLIYDVEGHYHAHTDTVMDPTQIECRKLTVLAFLNDDFEGGRLFLQIGHEKVYPPQKSGSVLVFPSFMLHGVEPVTKGIRRSIVTWVVGPWFK